MIFAVYVPTHANKYPSAFAIGKQLQQRCNVIDTAHDTIANKPMTSTGIINKTYRPDIDGLRAIAILSVVLYHAGVRSVSGGFTGVDIFFVISGYLIGGHIFAELWAGNFSFLRFYQRRAKRILPAFYAVLAFTIPAALLLLSPGEATDFGRSAFSAVLSYSNINCWHDAGYFNAQSGLSPLLMTWSLGVEEQFYAVIPLLMVLLVRVRRSWLLPSALGVCILSFLFAWIEINRHPSMTFYLLPSRAWELGAGVLLAVIELSRKRLSLPVPLIQMVSLAGAVLMIAPVFLLTSNSLFPGPAALPSVLGTALIIAVPASWINRRLLSLPPLVFVGKISYSLYLWHWPLLAYLRVASDNHLPPFAIYLAIAAAFAASVLSYYVVEQPFRRSTRAAGPLLIRYGAVSVFIAAVCAAIWLSNGVPQRFPHLAQIDSANHLLLKADPCLVVHDKLPQSTLCYNPLDPRPSVAVWGDSHSAALAPGLRSIANSEGYGFVQLGETGCLPLIGAANFQPGAPLAPAECMQFNRRALNLLQTDPRVKIVVLVGKWTDSFDQGTGAMWLVTDPAHEREAPSLDAASAIFRHSLLASIQALQDSGKQVIVVEPTPMFDFDPLMKIRTAQIPARYSLAKWMGSESASDTGFSPVSNTAAFASAESQLKMTLEGSHGVTMIDLEPELCGGGEECAYRNGERMLYSDFHHLTPDGAQYALRDFRFPSLAPAVTATQ
jgi:peptidoglycan/LPS O-acetylase OafA/YrhL